MTFMHAGLALAGVLCVAIPILIHLLLRQRRRPIVWAAMRFLMEAYKRQRRKLRLQQLILLALRCLLILMLAAALARPLLQQAGLMGGTGRIVYFLIDNGLASGTSDAPGTPTALDRHREAALAMLGELGPDDQAGLVALGGPADALVTPASSDHGAVATLIENLTTVDSATDFSGGLGRLNAELRAAADTGSEIVLVLLSDFYLASADVSQPLTASLADVGDITVVASPPRASSPGNVQITGVDPLRSVVLTGSGGVASDQNVQVTLRRWGPAVTEAATTQLNVRVSDAEPRPDDVQHQQSVRWKPGQSEATAWVKLDSTTSEDGATGQVLTASIDRDALPGDNTFRRTIEVRESLVVGLVDQRRFGSGPGAMSKTAADWLRLALQPTTGTPVDIREIEPAQVDAPTLSGLDAVFVPSPHLVQEDGWRRLRQFADRGGMVIVTPPAGVAVHLWPDAMERAFETGWRLARETGAEGSDNGWRLDENTFGPLMTLIESELTSLVRPVVIDRMLAIEAITPGTQTILSLRDGQPWLIAAAPGGESRGEDDGEGRGLLIYLASAPELEWTTLPAMPLMVPLTQELVRQGVGQASGAWSTIAGASVTPGPMTTRLQRVGGDEQILIDTQRYGQQAVRRAGVWRAVDDADHTRALVAVNADPVGGRLEVQAEGVVRTWIAEAVGAENVNDELGSGGVAWFDPAAPARILSAEERGSPVALPLLIAALVLALIEMLL
ncbi:MAG: BatA domain-containing protein, partial [Phycisphaerales bacterium]|nr:BatA domain-containing protein [Phycisphaerales bacterium]